MLAMCDPGLEHCLAPIKDPNDAERNLVTGINEEQGVTDGKDTVDEERGMTGDKDTIFDERDLMAWGNMIDPWLLIKGSIQRG
jgi:hypothetical protein